MARTTAAQMELVRAAVAMASKRTFHHLLYIGDLPLPDEAFHRHPGARKKLVQAVVAQAQRDIIVEKGIRVIALPRYDLGRAEKLKLAVVSGIAQGLYRHGEVIVALLSARPTHHPDSILAITVGPEDKDTSFGFLHAEGMRAEVLDALIDLAVSIGVEGWEGRPVGALFVIGDSNTVMEQSRPLSLNPFQGYSEEERDLLSPEVRRALHAFAVLDGAFVLRHDGVVLAAGRYLNFEKKDVHVPLGLGARHMAAAGVTRNTEAIAIVVSQTSGAIRVFRHGRVVLELAARAHR
jgi:DNA integrity scanning protein DisA with diadenylate cyclase activity